MGLNFEDDGLGDSVDEFNELVVVKADKQKHQQRRDEAEGLDEAEDLDEPEGQVVANKAIWFCCSCFTPSQNILQSSQKLKDISK